MADKLYPPIIEGALPAIVKYKTQDDGTVVYKYKMTVPFVLNQAVSFKEIKSFHFKISNVVSGQQISEFTIDKDRCTSEKPYIITPMKIQESHFVDTEVGQYVKVQIAFNDNNDITGYYSTVGTAKITELPTLTIESPYESAVNDGTEDKDVFIFQPKYIGKYENTDSTEKVFEYKFNLYSASKKLLFTTDWILHNTQYDQKESIIISQDENDQIERNIIISKDVCNLTNNLEDNKLYYIQYQVRTINGVEASTNITDYPVLKINCIKSDFDNKIDFMATNNFDNGYISLTINKKEEYLNQNIGSGVFRILRAAADSNKINESEFSEWEEIKRVSFYTNYNFNNWEFKDFTAEQGKHYQYALQQYNPDSYLYAEMIFSNIVLSDFEDMFLFDGEKQLKMRFNPKISSFKITRQEQKMDTLGNQYPIFLRNGKIAYHEFPINGLISYNMDEEELFLTNNDLGLKDYSSNERSRGPAKKTTTFTNIRNNNLNDYNFLAEREFKTAVLEWLGNGKYKLFRSPGEGNYLVRLMNISLSPEDKVSRMIHNFSATAYECAEYNYKNLEKFNIIDLSNPSEKSQKIYHTITLPYEALTKSIVISSYGYFKIENIQSGAAFNLTRGSSSPERIIIDNIDGTYRANVYENDTTDLQDIKLTFFAGSQYGKSQSQRCSITYRTLEDIDTSINNIKDFGLKYTELERRFTRARKNIFNYENKKDFNGMLKPKDNCDTEVYNYDVLYFHTFTIKNIKEKETDPEPTVVQIVLTPFTGSKVIYEVMPYNTLSLDSGLPYKQVWASGPVTVSLKYIRKIEKSENSGGSE